MRNNSTAVGMLLIIASAFSIPSSTAQDVVVLSGTTVSAATTTLPAFGSTAAACELATTGAEPFVAYSLFVDTDGSYTVAVVEPIDVSGNTDDTMFFLYANDFDASNACDNLVALGNETVGTGLTADLDDAVPYRLLVAGFLGTEDGYSFSVTGPAGANISVGELPIELESFSAVVDGTSVLLIWTVLSETESLGFDLQIRSGVSDPEPEWTTVAFVESAGETNLRRRYQHVVGELSPGVYGFRLKQIDKDGTVTFSSEVEARILLDVPFAISEVYPNPSVDRARMHLAVAEEQVVSINAYDLLGRHVAVLFDATVSPDKTYDIVLDLHSLPIGSYFVVIEGQSFRETRQATILR